MSWNEICCAVDFSEPSWLALERAVDLARRLDGALTLLHVSAPAYPGGEALVTGEAQTVDLTLRQLRARLESWGAGAERELGRPVHLRLLAGAPAREIARYATQGVDLLVVGTRGPTGLGRLLLGSVAERVVRDAPCPVMVVHRHDEAQPEAQAMI